MRFKNSLMLWQNKLECFIRQIFSVDFEGKFKLLHSVPICINVESSLKNLIKCTNATAYCAERSMMKMMPNYITI
jgi:hypothetical protein